MNEIEIRFECLRLALGTHNPTIPGDVVKTAGDFYAFVRLPAPTEAAEAKPTKTDGEA